MTSCASCDKPDTPLLVAVAAEVPAAGAPPPPPPRNIVYVTPLHAGYLPTLPAEQQQAYRDALNAVSLAHAPAPLDMTGVNVTPMPPPGTHIRPADSLSITPPEENGQSDASDIKQQRANRRNNVKNNEKSSVKQNGSRQGSGNAEETEATQQDMSNNTVEAQSPQEEVQVNEPLSKHAKKKAKKDRRKRAGQKSAVTGNDQAA